MSGRVVLHIGAMKTGTSFVQSVLGEHREQLTAIGVDFLGTFGQQMRCVQAGLRSPAELAGWQRLVAGARDGRTSIVSMEFLSFAGPRQVAAFLEPLRGHEVQVVLTARDQLRVLPAQWQSHTRNFGQASWDDYLRQVCRSRRPARQGLAYRTYHRAQDLVPIADRWIEHPGVSRFDLVTVPAPGAPREELWLRFCRALEISVDGVSLESVKDNPSIGYASCDVLRRLNDTMFGTPAGAGGRQRPHQDRPAAPRRAAAARMPGYRKLVREIVRESLAPLRTDEAKPVLDHAAATYAVTRNREIAGLAARARVGLVGSVDDLPAVARPGEFPATVAPPPADQVVRAAEAVWDHVARAARPAHARPRAVDDLTADSARMLLALAGGSAAPGQPA